MKSPVKRLLSQFKPTHYILAIEPDKDKKTFKGTVTIDGHKTGQPSQRIIFHQNGLKVKSATITYHDKNAERKVDVSRINAHAKFDEVRIHTDELLRPGKYTVEMVFEGRITNAMNGIYLSTFKEGKTEKQIIATQFESHHAREAFPCIDEPAAKATFDLILTTDKNQTVLANTPVKTETIVKDKVVSAFGTTPLMSTYLLAFVVGDLGYAEGKTKDGVIVRAYATKDKVKFLDFSVDVAVKCLDFYNDYFGIDYPLEKCDMVALPDFASGAMENWGLITYREQALLVDPENTSLANKQYIALVVAHELAHQWFGNLVTMRWWTDLWLNEGFASWMEYFAIDHIYPQWELWTQFAVDEQYQALSLDALENTHSIEVEVNHPDEIRTIFDAISYSKGASIINMLQHFVGAETFKQGLRYYLNEHSYSNTDTVDLWKSLEEVSDKPVRDFMHKWTTNVGFPLVQSNISDDEIILAQERFFVNPKHKIKDNQTWPIALLMNGNASNDLLMSKHATFKESGSKLTKLNNGQSGFYRVAYNASHLEKLGNLVKRGHLEPLDRLGVLSDVFETAKAGMFDTAEALHFLGFFNEEDNYAVWDVISSSLANLRLVMADDDLREAMKPYTLNLIETQLARLGIKRKDNDSHFDRLLRPTILSMAAVSDHPEIVKYCLDVFKKMHTVDELNPDLKNAAKRSSVRRGTLDPDLRGTVYGTVARLGGKSEFDKLLKLHNESSMSEERMALVGALTGFKQPELIKRALSLIISDDVRLQDVSYWIAYSFMNRYAKKQTWLWLKENWNWLSANMGTDLSFYRMPIYAARTFSEESFVKEYKDFFKPLITPSLDRSYKQGLEILEYQSAWRTRSLKEVKTFFSQDPK